jgi:outer membrane immunogenic protein
MKKFVGCLIAACFAGPAIAADLPVKAPPPAGAPIAYNWTGFYIGGHVGWAGRSQDASAAPGSTFFFLDPPLYLPNNFDLKNSSALGGMHLGYSWEAMPNLLIGVEGDISKISLNKSEAQQLICNPVYCGLPLFAEPGNTLRVSSTVNWLASLRARVGIIAAHTWLIYGTGGVAWGDISLAGNGNAIGAVAGNPGAFTVPYFSNALVEQTKSGWTAGGGLEWMFAKNWMLRAEYLYYRFDGESINAPVTFVFTPLLAGAAQRYSWSDLEIHTARVGISYKFD